MMIPDLDGVIERADRPASLAKPGSVNVNRAMASNFDTDEYARRAEAAGQLCEASSSRTPRANSFGFFAYGDAPAAIGGGLGVFQWFPSRKALLDYLGDHLTYQNLGQSGTDPFATHAAVKNAVNKFRRLDAPLKLLIPKLNPLLLTYSQIRWIGTLGDLKKGNTKYERGLRNKFRESLGSKAGTRPIQQSEIAAFRQFLSEYGF
jgi:hypothetical protein